MTNLMTNQRFIGRRPTISRRPLLILLASATFATCFVAQPAAAQTVNAEVLVILAKEEAGVIDASLESMTALRRAPFNAFRTMEIMSRSRERLRPNQHRDVTLPNGRVLRIELQRVMPDGRYRVRVSINRPDADSAAYLPLLQVMASPGDPFFVAGQSHDGGTLVIGITLQ